MERTVIQFDIGSFHRIKALDCPENIIPIFQPPHSPQLNPMGWLINPQDQQVEIYRVGQAVEVRNFPAELSGEQVLPGFVLRLPL